MRILRQDLRHPRFRVSLALTLRRCNHVWMLVILPSAWPLRIVSPDLRAGANVDNSRPIATPVGRAAIGPVGGWMVPTPVPGFHVGLAVAWIKGMDRGGYEVHVELKHCEGNISYRSATGKR